MLWNWQKGEIGAIFFDPAQQNKGYGHDVMFVIEHIGI